jgi:hypothetical protein
MDMRHIVQELRRTFDWTINLAFALARAMYRFVDEEWTRYEQRRVARAFFSPLSERSDDGSPFSGDTRCN